MTAPLQIESGRESMSFPPLPPHGPHVTTRLTPPKRRTTYHFPTLVLPNLVTSLPRLVPRQCSTLRPLRLWSKAQPIRIACPAACIMVRPAPKTLLKTPLFARLQGPKLNLLFFPLLEYITSFGTIPGRL